MLDMDTLNWEEPMAHRMKVERNLNFATLPNDEDDFGFSRKKTARDPMSHRIIEKRRRDRMNNCLADLSRLVPTNYLKKGRGRIEKTEIIEMAIKHLKHLQAHPCKDPGSCEVAKATEQDHRRQFRQGYQECMSETMKFMMEVEGSWGVGDGVGIRLVNHLQKHYDKIGGGGLCYTQALNLMASEDSKSAVQVMEVDNGSNGSFLQASSESNHSTNNGQPQQHTTPSSYSFESDNSNHPSRATSQLREMLQNPGVPKDARNTAAATSPTRHGATSPPQPPSGNEFHRIVGEDSHPRHIDASAVPSGDDYHRIGAEDISPMSYQHRGATSPQHHSATSPQHRGATSPQHNSGGGEDSCYKFKNTIKHRFNADLRHHTSSPTDSHVSDRMSPPPPALLRCSPHHAFSPYAQTPELTVKIPDRTGSDGYPHHPHWDSHAETASSCGSNPSPPPVRSSGSSSGYSTNGENNHPCGTKGVGGPKGLGPLSPPYSPPSPPHPPGVPVFALHPKGAFYIPLTLESSLLVPYMVGIDEAPPVLHPISICVNLGAHSVKVEKPHQHHPYGATRPHVVQQSSSFLMDKFHDRLVYQERYYACPASPAKNGCV